MREKKNTILSANTVGYNTGAVENFTFVGPSFTKIGGNTTFTYADIIVNCDETGEGDGLICVFLLFLNL